MFSDSKPEQWELTLKCWIKKFVIATQSCWPLEPERLIVGFYGKSINVGYLIPNPLYISIYIDLNICDL